VSGLADEVVRALSLCPGDSDGHLAVLASGCSEGIYLRSVGEHAAMEGAVELWGVDERKLAVRYAASRQRGAHFAVASPHQLPFADGSMDVVFAAFSPAPWEEFCRVLRPGGAVVVARSGPDHLKELKQALAGARGRASGPRESAAGLGENYVRVRTVEEYGPDAASALLAMSPFVREAHEERRRELEASAAAGCTTTVDLIVSTHRVWLGTGGEPI
jgi:23S rRNA (guanine745-N1)-methyltransferase